MKGHSDRIEASSLVKCRSYGAANGAINIKRAPGACFKENFPARTRQPAPFEKSPYGPMNPY